MASLDNRYFNEYKRLDKLLMDCYNSDKGVSTYIELMEENDARGMSAVENWKSDYKTLKHLRYLRNKIAHDEVEGIITEKDMNDLTVFHDRVMKGTDPMALLSKKQQRRKRAAVNTVQRTDAPAGRYTDAPSNDSQLGSAIAFFISIAIIVLFIVIFTR